jgi:hypothetical protein
LLGRQACQMNASQLLSCPSVHQLLKCVMVCRNCGAQCCQSVVYQPVLNGAQPSNHPQHTQSGALELLRQEVSNRLDVLGTYI